MKRINPERTKLGRILLTRIWELEKYFRRWLGMSLIEKNKYFLDIPDNFSSSEIERIIYNIRGKTYKPAIFIHGVLPRSGTNYLADLMARHENVFSYTGYYYEFPLLSFTRNVMDLQSDFNRRILNYPAVLKPFEFSAYINAGMMMNLQQKSDPTKVMLFKYPCVEYLDLFRTFFPRDYLILILRDGRDVVSSSIKTFGTGLFKEKFSDYCREWDYATRCILNYCNVKPYSYDSTLVIKYEELYKDTENTISRILKQFKLDFNGFDFKNLKIQPIRGSSALPNEDGIVTWKPQRVNDKFNPIGRWKKWTKSQKCQFKKYAGQSLIDAGYETTNEW